MKIIYYLLLSLHLATPTHIIKEGDILFQDLDCGPLCTAIETATTGYHNYNISHIGFVVKIKDKKYVLEAYKHVQITPLNDFLKRSKDTKGNPKIIVTRLKKKYKHLIPEAKKYGLKQINKSYDEYFMLDNNAYYCCELIYDMFKHANSDTDFFHLYPMNFKSLKTGKMPDVWIKYFNKLGIEIPQDKLGCNPAKYSKNKHLKVIAILGNLDKNN